MLSNVFTSIELKDKPKIFTTKRQTGIKIFCVSNCTFHFNSSRIGDSKYGMPLFQVVKNNQVVGHFWHNFSTLFNFYLIVLGSIFDFLSTCSCYPLKNQSLIEITTIMPPPTSVRCNLSYRLNVMLTRTSSPVKASERKLKFPEVKYD